MNALLYKRDKCQSDFILVTEDADLLETYGQMYRCEPVEIRGKVETESDFRKLHKQLTEKYPKKFCCVCDLPNSYAALTLLPGAAHIQKTDTRTINILQIIENFMYLTLIPEDGIITLHGAAVAKGDKAFLLSARTTAGKSTLTAFLWMAGYEYITDDEIFISQKTLAVETVRKTLSLRPGGYEVLQKIFPNGEARLNAVKRIAYGNNDRYLLPIPEAPRHAQYKIAAIVFLEEYGSPAPYLKKLNACDGFQKLLKGQLSAKEDTPILVKYKTLAQLSQNTYEMRYSDLWTAETYLKHLL